MMIGFSPSALRMAAVSNGEQTIALAPALTESLARATALSSAGLAYPISKRSLSEIEVRIVTAVIEIFEQHRLLLEPSLNPRLREPLRILVVDEKSP